jgi:hypothetical protein
MNNRLNKSTHSRVKLDKVLLLWCFILFLPLTLTAQLIVEKHTLVYLKQEITSKVSHNYFFSSIDGDKALVLSAEAKMLYLEKGVFLHSLVIDNASSLQIQSPITIRSNFSVKSGILSLNYPVKITGQIKLSVDVLLANPEYIISTRNYTTTFVLPFSQNSVSQPVWSTINFLLTSEIFYFDKKNNHDDHLTPLYTQYKMLPPTPPPGILKLV